MKNILLACILLAATSTISNAQAIRPTASKSDFITKVNDLNTYILAGRMVDAQAKWDQINLIGQAEFGVLKFKMIDDVAAHNTADYTHCQTLNDTQRTLFLDIQTLKTNLALNRAALIAKLNLFAADML